MNCPRCTHEIPEEGRYCPACGLDLEQVEEEARAAAAVANEMTTTEAHTADAMMPEPEYWPKHFRINPTRGGKRPFLAVTLAFFFGPFAYLYLEQSVWFWWGLLGGFLLILLSRFDLLPLLVIGFMVHAYDVATTLNENEGLRQIEA
jgi:hypothetical protein